MAKKIYGLIIILSLILTTFSFVKPAKAVSYTDLASHWAPKIYQDVNTTYGVRADFVTNFNYDGDWIGNNNWNNLYNYPENGYVYYKVQETDTHYFIEYDFFHARDDGPTSPDAHENDLEGMLLALKKDGSTYGSFHLMETMAHNQWYQYTNDPSITTGSDNVDGGVLFEGSHPKVFIQSNGQSPWGGHGVFAYDGTGAPGGDGIVYDYTGIAEFPTDAAGDYTHAYGFALQSIDEFWNRRYDVGGAGHTYETFGVFDGDDYTTDSAKAPWMWDDSDDGPTFEGMNFSDPAHQIDTHLNGLGGFSHNYLYNPYYSHKITLNTITSNANRDPFGGKSDIYVKIYVNGQGFSDDRLWKFNDSTLGAARSVIWGHDSAAFGNNFSSNYSTIYVTKAHNVEVNLNVLDSDGTSGDDDMGSLSAYPVPGQTVTYSNTYTSSGQALVSATVSANIE